MRMIQILGLLGLCLGLASCSEPCKQMFPEGTVVRDKLTGDRAIIVDTAMSARNDQGYCLVDVVWSYKSWTEIYVNPARFDKED